MTQQEIYQSSRITARVGGCYHGLITSNVQAVFKHLVKTRPFERVQIYDGTRLMLEHIPTQELISQLDLFPVL